MLIREMTTADLPSGLALCRAAGWNQTAADWRAFLTAAPHGARVAEDAGRIVGSVATMPYGPFTWISMVLVDPAARGRGVGTRLLECGLDLVPAGVAARLDATPLGEPLYRKLGFTAEYSLARLTRDAGVSQRPTVGDDEAVAVRRFTGADWPLVLSLDASVFGASRRELLAALAAGSPDLAWIAERDGRLCGFVFGRPGHARTHIGPLVAADRGAASRLLDASLAALPDRPVLLDVPDAHTSWRAHLAALGFVVERPFLRMCRGALTTPGDPSRVYAVTGPEFG